MVGTDQAVRPNPIRQIVEAAKVLSGTPRAVKLALSVSPRMSVCLFVVTVILGALPALELWLGKLIIDTITVALRASVAPSLSYLGWLVAAVGLTRLTSTVLEAAMKTLQEHLGEMMTREVSLRILVKTNTLKDLSLLENPSFHDKLTRAQNEAGYRPAQMTSGLMHLCVTSASLFSMFGLLFFFCPLLPIAIVLLSLPNLFASFRMEKEAWQIHNHEVPEVRRMNYFRSIFASLYDAKELRLFNLGGYFLDRYLEKFDEYQVRHKAQRVRRFFVNLSLSMSAAFSQAMSYFYIVYQAAVGKITVGSLALYLNAVAQLEMSITHVMWSLSALHSGNLFLSNLFEFLDAEPPPHLILQNEPVPVPCPFKKGIRFDNVSFKYPDSERLILEDINFTLLPNQSVALVGENGAGKSTLVKLITRLYEPTSGRILIDDVDLRDLDIDEWRTKLSVILQEYARFHLLARENIGVGNVEFINDGDRVQTASERANAVAVVEKLPDRFETMLGRYYAEDSGSSVDLSGGEWQKIALARAYMRSESAELLILDEPTSALDAQAEYEVFLRFNELTKDKLTFLISHRFSTVKMADIIMVLDKGKVIEQGSHSSLIEQDGTYARLYNMQADRYK